MNSQKRLVEKVASAVQTVRLFHVIPCPACGSDSYVGLIKPTRPNKIFYKCKTCGDMDEVDMRNYHE